MTIQSRLTLKGRFKEGRLPNSQDYSDLIESNVNRLDDGFDKTKKYGLRIASQGKYPVLMSFASGIGNVQPIWVIERDKAEALHFRTSPTDISGEQTDKASNLSLAPSGKIGINTNRPEYALDVEGTIKSSGRIGAPTHRLAKPHKEIVILADGSWQDITESLEGCHAFEVVAGVGGKKTDGRYALLHAIALNAYNPRNWILNWIFSRRNIRRQSAQFGRYSDRIKLRWKNDTDGRGRNYKLQMRTASNFEDEEGNSYKIQYHITRLWFDSEMSGSRSSDPSLTVEISETGSADG